MVELDKHGPIWWVGHLERMENEMTRRIYKSGVLENLRERCQQEIERYLECKT